MRVGLISPYSWTYPGGVLRHIEALACELLAAGHEVRVLAPYDHDDRRTALLHRGTRPQRRTAPDWLVPLGGTIGWPVNGAVSNLAGTPSAVVKLRRELRAGQFDVVHVHEPVAPTIGWDTLTSADVPLVGTFHCYSESAPPHAIANLMGARRKLNRLTVRIAVSDAAAWTGRRFYGGEYRVVPNGVTLPDGGAPPARVRAPGEPLEIVFVGQALDRKGLPILLRAFEALREHVPGAADDRRRVGVRGRAAAGRSRGRDRAGPRVRRREARRARGRRRAGRAVAGRRVVRHGPDGELRRRHAGRGLRHRRLPRRGARRGRRSARPARRRHRAGRDAARPRAGAASAPPRSAPPQERAPSATPGRRWPRGSSPPTRTRAPIPQPEGAAERAAVRVGLRSADLGPRRPARRLPSLEPAPTAARRDRRPAAPRCAAARGARRRRRLLPRAGPDRARSGRAHARHLEPDLGGGQPRADVRLDDLQGGLLARDPQGGAAGVPPALHRRVAGHGGGRADVRDVARAPRRAVARADRRAPARAPARGAARRDRHARLADADQRARAR